MTNNISTFAIIHLLFISTLLFSQAQPIDLEEHPDDEYIYVPRDLQPKSAAYQFTNQNVTCVQVNVDSDGNNILGDAANEPSIAIDPNDPNRMVMGWRQFDTIASNFRQAGFAFTLDKGETWTFPGPIEPGIFRSDPVLDFDNDGNFYYNSLRVEGNDFWCEVFRSTGNGTWGPSTYAYGGDKQWMAIDRTGGIGESNIYTSWNSAFSACDENFTRSTDSGNFFEDCTLVTDNPIWGTLSIGPDGTLYAAGNGGVFLKSDNAQNSSQTVQWGASSIAPIGGFLQAFATVAPNPGGLHGQQWIATDHSGGPTHGNIYMLGSIGTSNDPLNVHFIKSTDGGQTWTQPYVINDDNSNENWQWFGTMSVAPNGRIDVIWLDTRDNPNTFLSSLYYSYSMDGGDLWSDNQRLSDEFDPHLGWPNQNKMGDYFDMVSTNEGAHLGWAGTFNGEQDVYYSFITPNLVSNTYFIRNEKGSLLQNFPNPFSSQTTIPFTIANHAFIDLSIYDVYGKLIRTLLQENRSTGKYTEIWDKKDGAKNEVSKGVYFINLKINGEVYSSKKMLVY